MLVELPSTELEPPCLTKFVAEARRMGLDASRHFSQAFSCGPPDRTSKGGESCRFRSAV